MGSLEARGKHTWRLVVSDGFDGAGHRRRRTKTVYCRTKSEALTALKRFEAEVVLESKHEHADMSLNTWASVWIEECRTRLAPATVTHYVTHLRERILPALGPLGLSRITAADIHGLLRRTIHLRLDAKGGGGMVTPTTVRRVYQVLSSCLQEAVFRGLISANPARAVRPPRSPRREAAFYSPGDVERLLAAIAQEEPPAFRALVLLALSTGARRGELLALEWRHVRFEDGSIAIAQALDTSDAIRRLKPTKSGATRRVIVGPPMLDVLRALAGAQALAREMGTASAGWRDWVFRWPDGSRLDPDWVTRQFSRVVAKHNLPPLTFHGLRHTAASLLIGEGVPVRTVSAILGHSQASTTLNVYAHVVEEANRRASEVLAKFLQVSPGLSPGIGEHP
jgi:integrase